MSEGSGPGARLIVDVRDPRTELRAQKFAPTTHIELVDGGQPLLGFTWGRHDGVGTAAYWVDQARDGTAPRSFALGETLAEEIAACLLGGYGVPAAIGLGFYNHIRGLGLLSSGTPKAEQLQDALSVALPIGKGGRPVRYRFARQRAHRIADALAFVGEDRVPSTPLELRDWLTGAPGIGLKTASWIVRNQTASDRVAVIDVHLVRAGTAAGFFSRSWRLPRDYSLFEAAFLTYAWIGGVNAALLDSRIWYQMQYLGRGAEDLLPAAK